VMDGAEELRNLMKERDESKRQVTILRKDLRDFNTSKKDLIESIKAKNRNAEGFKSKRDRFNFKIQELKKERGKINDEIKDLFSKYKEIRQDSPKKDFKRMEVELDRLEWTLQTRVLKVEKEDELVKRVEQLTSELKEFKELKKNPHEDTVEL
jgi:uncharacterized coiled-coil DUF342 family protein